MGRACKVSEMFKYIYIQFFKRQSARHSVRHAGVKTGLGMELLVNLS